MVVHLIPHSHDDVGWLKTVDEYYYNWNRGTFNACVRDILNTVSKALIDNPQRTFTQVEIKFFSMWWAEQTDEMKA